jgi:hypothetical protein
MWQSRARNILSKRPTEKHTLTETPCSTPKLENTMSKGIRAFRPSGPNNRVESLGYVVPWGEWKPIYKFCQSCGFRLQKALDYTRLFNRETGERLCVRKIVCSTDIKSGHDTYYDSVDQYMSADAFIVNTDEPQAKQWLGEPL